MTQLERLSVCALILAALTACGTDRTGAQDTVASETQAPNEGALVSSCQDLLDAGWVAPKSDPNINYDPATGIAEVSFGTSEPLVVDLANDEMCAFLPGLGGILSRVLPEYEAARIQECTDAVQVVVSGVVPRKGDVVVADIDALRAHILEWCPPSFGERLRQLEATTTRER